ncbi:MAG: alpha-glucan family phosphorylase [Dehalococcoidia bacterium]
MSVVAYFSMDLALESDIPTYSGGLGVLAGDMLRSAADLGLPLVGVSLLYRKGYFHQRLDAAGNQIEADDGWRPEGRLTELPARVAVQIEGRSVQLRAWRYCIRGARGCELPVFLLDSDLPENAPEDRGLTDHLYGGDPRYRLAQEVVLGIGGVQLLRALGYTDIPTFHMNEGHSALLALALLHERLGERPIASAGDGDLDAVRQRCVFTTHTPVSAGHDKFEWDLVYRLLGEEHASFLQSSAAPGERLNMTHLALRFARYVNAVALRHAQVSRQMFPEQTVHAITNGVHTATWLAPSFKQLYDRHMPDWRLDSSDLRHAVAIPLSDIDDAHIEAKRRLLHEVANRSDQILLPGAFTIGFARRAATYKRADLVFSDIERLRRIADRIGPIQFIYSGKAHPQDVGGKDVIRRVFEAHRALRDEVPVVYLEDYDMELGGLVCAGVDLWLNTPEQPLEASGTSGMKAALNGVPSLSVLDGWWIEGHVEGVTGWAIGMSPWDGVLHPSDEADSLYTKLESSILPMFYGARERYNDVQRSAIALNGSFFNTERMVRQYAANAYGLYA